MAVPGLQPRTSWNVRVDSFETQAMLSFAMVAVSGPSLAGFLDDKAANWLHEEIGLRFAYEGDRKSGDWPRLQESTNQIREALGFPADTPINIRTGDLEEFVTTAHDVTQGPMSASMDLPGDVPDPVLAKKLRTAQQGASSGENPFPGTGPTPPRPVLAVDETDMVELLARLEAHIVTQVIGMTV
jgi:hypothetical protein